MTAHARQVELTPQNVADVSMAATLHWLIIQLVAQGHSLAAAEAALTRGVLTEATALREAGLK
ncbi:hypothetical protein [Roseicyclus marinus]|uniref:hypothetical protein n=1 Tax=Roseicyclus marinus TaxID=2161673 RepID=UPI00240F084E|nr:hypothetical protein [Roseicyclus marinus]MDG3040464.1 hypothetical protein [Roseicyclus marinus]